MSRRFSAPASGDWIDTAIGNVGQLGAGAFSLMFLTKLRVVINHGLIRLDAASVGTAGEGSANLGINPFSDGRTYLTLSGFTSDNGSIAAYTGADGWIIYVVTKAAGSAIPRWHRYKFDTNTWEHGSGGVGTTIAAETNNVPTRVRHGRLTAGDILDGWLGASVLYNAVISDATLDNTATLKTSLPAWLALPNVVGGWRFDRGNVRDLSGGAAHEGAINGTKLDPTEEPAGWSYAAASETLWTPSDGPAGGADDFSDGVGGISTATSIQFTQSGTIDAIRFRATLNSQTSPNANYRGTIFHVDNQDGGAGAGTKIAQTNTFKGSLLAQGAWNEIALNTPLAVTPGNLYRVAIWNDAGRYCATNHGFDTGHTSAGGHMIAPQDGTNPVGLGSQYQGSFVLSADPDTYPANVGQAANYWVDAVFTPSGGAPAFDATRFLSFF